MMYNEDYTTALNSFSELVNQLTKYGFTREEAHLYCYLISVKSATVQEIIKSAEFKAKQRTNIYKVISALKTKDAIVEEEKEGKIRIFPIRPNFLMLHFIETEKIRIKELEALSQTILTSFDSLELNPNPNFMQLPQKFQQILDEIIPKSWILREMPYFHEEKGLGQIISVEYKTIRKFAGDSAGVIFQIYNYAEHAEAKFAEAVKYNLDQMKKGLDIHGAGKFFNFKVVSIQEKQISVNPDLQLSYSEFCVQTNLGIKANSAMITVITREFPQYILTFWSADWRDFKKIIEKVFQKFHPYQID